MVVALRPVLIAGVPRSGSSWVGRTLGRAPGVAYVHEPDNEKRDPFALKAKAKLGRFPVLAADDDAADYERLWQGAFAGGVVSEDARHRSALSRFTQLTKEELEAAASGEARGPGVRLAAAAALPRTAGPEPARAIVKSVHAPLALPWIRRRFDLDLVVVERHPLNVLASMFDLDMPDRDRRLDGSLRVIHDYAERWGVTPPGAAASPLQRAAWQAGLLQSALAEERGVARTVSHEALCTDPVASFRSIFEGLSLAWSDDVEEHLRSSDRPGGGYKTQRVAADQPERWKRRFGRDEVEVVRDVLMPFPLPGWPRDGSAP